MKTLASITLPLVTLFSPALACLPAAASKATTAAPAAVHPVGRAERFNGGVVTRGTGRHEVLLALGTPSRKLSDEAWVYSNYDGGDAQSPNCDCCMLVVTFKNGEVADLNLYNRRGVDVLAKQLNASSSN
jgi:hypothetical protein